MPTNLLEKNNTLEPQTQQTYAGIALSPYENDMMERLASVSDDPDGTRLRCAGAIIASRYTGLDLDACYQNIDSISKMQLGEKFEKSQTWLGSIVSSYKIGNLQNSRNEYAKEYAKAMMSGRDYTAYDNAVKSIDSQIGELQVGLKNGGFAKFAANLPYMFNLGAANLVGTGIGAVVGTAIGLATGGIGTPMGAYLGAKLAKTFGMIAGGLLEVERTREIMWGTMFYDYVNEYGVDPDVAYHMAQISSTLSGLIEATLDEAIGGMTSQWKQTFFNVTKGGNLADWAVALMAKTGDNLTVASYLTRLAVSASGEGTEEFVEEIKDVICRNVAITMSGFEVPVEDSLKTAEGWKNAIGQGIESWVDGALIGLIGGAVPTFLNETRGDIGRTKAFRDFAQTSETKQEYEAKVEKAGLLDGLNVTNEVKQEVVDSIWENKRNADARADYVKLKDKALSIITDTGEIDASVNEETGEVVDAKATPSVAEAKYIPGTRQVYMQESRYASQAGRQVMNFGSGDTSDMVSYANADGTTSRKRALYGTLEYSVGDDGKVTIHEVSFRNGVGQQYRVDAVNQFIQSFPGAEIDFQATTQNEMDIRDAILKANGGKLQTEFVSNAADHAQTVSTLRSIMDIRKPSTGVTLDTRETESYANSIIEATSAMIEQIAKGEGISGQQWIRNNLSAIREAKNGELDLPNGRQANGKTELERIGNEMRSVIWYGKNADAHTFLHELNHVVMRQAGHRAEFAKVFDGARNSATLLNFIKDNWSTFSGTFGKMGSMEDLRKLVDTLYRNGDNWTREDMEFEASLYEAYAARRGELGNKPVSAFFRKISTWMRSIYRSIRGTTELNQEIVDYYDRLYGMDGKQGESQGQSGDGELMQLSDAEEAERQYKEIEARYKGTEQWLKAPNGKATNLTERQWVQVRTPAFKANYFGFWNLPNHMFNVVNAKHATFNNSDDALVWAEKNGIIGMMKAEETNGKGDINISKTSVREMLNPQQRKKSVSAEAHYSALTMLRDIIRESELVDRHPDYKKGVDGIRSESNGINKNVIIDVLYGAIRIEDETYRVKTTLKRFVQKSTPTKAYSYDISEIEVLAGTLGQADYAPSPSTNTSISGKSLLQGVKNSKGKPVLDDFSKILDENGEPKVVYHGTKNRFDVFDPEMWGESTDAGYYGHGFYFSEIEAEARSYSGSGENDVLMSVFLNIRKPIDFDALYAPVFDSAQTDSWLGFLYNAAKSYPSTMGEAVFAFNWDDELSLNEYAAKIDEYSKKSETPISDFMEDYEVDIDEMFMDLDSMDSNLADEIDITIMRGLADGVINAGSARELVVRKSNQIKSATDNNGAFDAGNDSILYQSVDLTAEFADISKGKITEKDIENHINSLIGQILETATEPLQIQITRGNKYHVIYSNQKLERGKKQRHEAALSKIEKIIGNATYTDTEPTDLTHNTSKRTLRHKEGILEYVSFESPVEINGVLYSVVFTTERVKGQNPDVLDLYNVRVKKNGSTGTNLIAFPQNQFGYTTSAENVKSQSDLFQTSDTDVLFQGYDWSRGMSNNAVAAYENGEKPMSKWTKDAFYDALVDECGKEVADILSKLPQTIKKQILLEQTSWHHTGKYFNRTDFYSLKDSVKEMDAETARQAVEGYKKYTEAVKEYNRKVSETKQLDSVTADVTVSGETIPFTFSQSDLSYETYGVYAQAKAILGRYKNVPARMQAFFDRAKSTTKNYDSSRSGNVYIYGEKPVSAEVKPGTERLHYDEEAKRTVFQVYDNGWKDVESYDGVEPATLFEDVVGRTVSATILHKPALYNYVYFNSNPVGIREYDENVGAWSPYYQMPEDKYKDGGTSKKTADIVKNLPKFMQTSVRPYFLVFNSEGVSCFSDGIGLVSVEPAIEIEEKNYQKIKGKWEENTFIPDDVRGKASTLNVKNYAYTVSGAEIKEIAKNGGNFIVGSNVYTFRRFYNGKWQLNTNFTKWIPNDSVLLVGQSDGNYPRLTFTLPMSDGANVSLTTMPLGGDIDEHPDAVNLKTLSSIVASYPETPDYADTLSSLIAESFSFEDFVRRAQEAFPETVLDMADLQERYEEARPVSGSSNPGTLESPAQDYFGDKAQQFTEILSDETVFTSFLKALGNAANLDDAAMFVHNLATSLKDGKPVSTDDFRKAYAIVEKNPEKYMNLYSEATANAYWENGDADTDTGSIAEAVPDEFSPVGHERRMDVAEGIRDKELRDKIDRGESTTDDVDDALNAQEQVIADLEKKIKELEDSLKTAEKQRDKSRRNASDLKKSSNEQLRMLNDAQKAIRQQQERLYNLMTRQLGMTPEFARQRIDALEAGTPQSEYSIADIRKLFADKAQNFTAKQINELAHAYSQYATALRNRATAEVRADERAKASENYRKLREQRDKAVRDLKDEYRQREALRKMRRYKEMLANRIKRKVSNKVNWDEAQQIMAIQSLIDPAFRERAKFNGKMLDIHDLKNLFRMNPDLNMFEGLTDEEMLALTRKDLNELTVSELEKLATICDFLRRMGLYKWQARVDARHMTEMQLGDILMDELRRSPHYKEDLPERDSKEAESYGKTPQGWYLKLNGWALNWARKAQILDNGKKGAWYDYTVRKVRELQADEYRATQKRIAPILQAMKENGVKAEDFYKTYTIMIEGNPETITLSKMIYRYLAQNNEDNLNAIKYGKYITEADKKWAKQMFLNGMDGDKLYSQYIVELGNRKYAQFLAQAKPILESEENRGIMNVVKAIEADFNSDAFNRVTEIMLRAYNMPVTKVDYYLPLRRTDLKGDAGDSQLREDILMRVSGSKRSASVSKGSTNERIKIGAAHQSNVNDDFLQVWNNSVEEQEHIVAFLEYTRSLNNVVGANSAKASLLREHIRQIYGEGILKDLDTHLQEIANPRAGEVRDGVDKTVHFLRGGLYGAYLGYNLSTVINQAITSPAAFLGKVGPANLVKSYIQIMGNFKEIWAEICELSPFMASRSIDPMREYIANERERADKSKLGKAVSTFQDIGLRGLDWIDRAAVAGGWYAIYQNELSKMEGGSSAENMRKAAAIADEYVVETQPVSDKKELAPLFKKGGEAMKILTQFQTSLNVIWNNITFDVPIAFKNHEYMKAIGMLTGYFASGALLLLITEGFDDDDDDKDKAVKLVYSFLNQPIAGIPLVSNEIDSVLRKTTNAIVGEKILDEQSFNGSTNFPFLQKGLQSVKAVADSDWDKALDYAVDTAMLATGLPYTLKKQIREAMEGNPFSFIGR